VLRVAYELIFVDKAEEIKELDGKIDGLKRPNIA
jgi:hypothetical protein